MAVASVEVVIGVSDAFDPFSVFATPVPVNDHVIACPKVLV